MFDLDLLHLKSGLALEFRSKQFEDLVIEKYESFLYKRFFLFFVVCSCLSVLRQASSAKLDVVSKKHSKQQELGKTEQRLFSGSTRQRRVPRYQGRQGPGRQSSSLPLERSAR